MEELTPGDPRYIGSYRLLGRLGSGGMGHVFLGQSPGGRRVAVKVIRPELAGAPDFRRRFAREVTAARRVSGIFTAPVVDADPAAPQPWLVTAYVDGPSLADHALRNGAMPESDVIRLGRALAEGLGAIHAAGIVHRDLKPSNVLLASDGPRIIDFGISRAAEESSLTQSGMVFGSPGFMSPEQADGREVGAASDVFSLGAVLAFAATGTEPFGTGASSALLYRVVHAEPALAGLSGAVHEVVSACLRKNPAERPSPGQLISMMMSLGIAQPRPRDVMPASVGPPEPVRASYSPRDLSDHRPVSHSGGPPAGAALAMQNGGSGAGTTRRRRQLPWMALCVAIALVAGIGAFLVVHSSGSGKPPAAGSSDRGGTAASADPGPRAVVQAYFAAINHHDWPRVWELGGKNLGQSFATMKAGFLHTGHDVIIDMTAVGDAVTVRFRAFDTTDAVQIYVDKYTVSGGVIRSGVSDLIKTYSSCPRITYGADGTAGPLFCADGQANPPVLAFYRKKDLRVLRLGADASPTEVVQAMCSDLRRGSSYQIETGAYKLAQKINSWSFGISPPQEMVDSGCT